MTTIRCQALLFDMDGVLVDSTDAVARVWRKWAIERGFDPEKVVRAAHGRPSIDTVRDFLPNADSHSENLEVERQEIEDLEGVVAIRGAVELVRSLPAGRWTVVTSATRPLAEVRLRAAGIPGREGCGFACDQFPNDLRPRGTGARGSGLGGAQLRRHRGHLRRKQRAH